jgi:subtilisin family serine protease
MKTGSRSASTVSCARIVHQIPARTYYHILVAVVLASVVLLENAVASPHKAFPGRYVVSLPTVAQSSGSVAISASRMLPNGVEVKDIVRKDLFVIQKTSDVSSAKTLSAAPIDPDDSFCKDIIANGYATSCSPDYVVHASTTTPNDPNYSKLYGLSATQGMDAPRAWELTVGSNDVVVGVVDTGIDYDHPDLKANMWTNPGEIANNGIDDDRNGVVDDVYGFNAIVNSGDPRDDNIHGTHCAGTIGAVGNNSIGVVGVNQTVKMMALKFLDRSGSGSLSNAIKAIDYAVAIKQKYNIPRMVLNNSWGGGGFSQPLYDAIQRANAAGIVFVAAAGNEGNDNDLNPAYPGSYELPNVVSVAAIDKNGNIASFSNYGSSAVDIAAGGVDILSTAPNGAYASLSGTSMASPHVAGALALLWAYDASLTPSALITRLYESGRTLSTLVDTNSGAALVRTQRAVDVGRMVHGNVAPLPSGGIEVPGCGYDFITSNLLASGEAIDTAADNQPLVNQADEGSYYAVPLKFSFPFFRGSASVVYLSPNGVVYTKVPTGLDYQTGQRAPFNAIAALHTDLTPTKSNHGIRVYSGPEKLTVVWTHEHYAAQGQGEVQARLTLYPNGVVKTSVAFGPAGEFVNVRKTVLGDPFAAPATSSKALIGLSGGSGAFSSTLDIAAAQRAALPSGNDPLILGVTMNPNCSGGGGGSGEGPVVQKISLKEQSVRANKSGKPGSIVGKLKGKGSGVVPLSVTINRVKCQQVGQLTMTAGSGRFTTKSPQLPVRLTFSSNGASRTLNMKSSGARRVVSAARIQLMCRTVVGSLK